MKCCRSALVASADGALAVPQGGLGAGACSATGQAGGRGLQYHRAGWGQGLGCYSNIERRGCGCWVRVRYGSGVGNQSTEVYAFEQLICAAID